MNYIGSRGFLWNIIRIGAYLGFAFTLLFNLWSVELWLTNDGILEWPNTLHVILIQGTVFLISTLGIISYLYRRKIETTLAKMTVSNQALLLLLALIGIEAFLGVAFLLTQQHPGFSDWGSLNHIFHLNYEFNIPTLFSVGQIWVAAAIVFLCITRTIKANKNSVQILSTWIIAFITLVFLGFDELLSIHEDAEWVLISLGVIDQQFDNRLGGYGYAWTLVALPIAISLGLYFLFGFLHIFKTKKQLFFVLVIAGITFITGAVLMENIQVYLIDPHQLQKGPRLLLLAEELLEMLGISFAIYVFFYHARELDIDINESLNKEKQRSD